jgi:hypothetical protein
MARRQTSNPLFTGVRGIRILGSSSMNSSYGGCVAPLLGGIMLVVERVGLLLESGSERRTLYVCGTEQGSLPAHP